MFINFFVAINIHLFIHLFIYLKRVLLKKRFSTPDPSKNTFNEPATPVQEIAASCTP
jgi:hypothetical protein